MTRANAVGEGVVGGTLSLFVVCALLYGYYQWRERLAARNRKALLLVSRTDTENPQAAASEVIKEPSMTKDRLPPVPSFVCSHFSDSADPFSDAYIRAFVELFSINSGLERVSHVVWSTTTSST